MDKIKISVIMGIYNCESTLPEAIDSLLRQTYRGWKLIMCDDGSEDGTYAVAKRYQEEYPDKIVLIKNKKNKGLNDTLNRCLKYADTEFIARMDGDDISLPTRFEEEIRFLDEHKEYAIVSTQMIYFDGSGEFCRGRESGEPKVSDMVKGTPFCHAPCMVRKEAYDAIGGYSNAKNKLRVEDWDLWIRMYEKGFKGYNIGKPLYEMRDDRNAYKRRKFKFRLNEAYVSRLAVKTFGLPKWMYIYSFRFIIVGLLPMPIYNYLHRKKINAKDK